LESEALEYARDAFSRIERKVFDAHLGVDKFDLRRLDADGLLFFSFYATSGTLALVHKIFKHYRETLLDSIPDVPKSLVFCPALREASWNFEALGDDVAIFAGIGGHCEFSHQASWFILNRIRQQNQLA
jgi:hypothetical protein